MHRPLTRSLGGQHILVTRPAGQADSLVTGIEQLGGRATHIPLLAIKPLDDLQDLEKIAGHLDRYRACVFISANAVKVAWPVLTRQTPWPDALPAAVVGPGTARVLRELGLRHVLQPETQFDSEGLLALPCFAPDQCQDGAFAFIRGEGGRDLMATTLRARGGDVDEASVYQRSLDTQAVDAVAHLFLHDRPAAMIVTSSESLDRLMQAAPVTLAQAVRDVQMIVPHARIAQAARSHGFTKVAICDGGDEGILRFLQTYNE